MNEHYRHGDILLIRIDKLPENVKFKTKKSKVILEGEVTGHAHKLKGDARILEIAERIANNPNGVWDERKKRLVAYIPPQAEPKSQVIGYVLVKGPTELIHEEHKTITLPVGDYEVRRQREYDSEYIRFVED